MVIKLKVEANGKMTGQEIEIELCDEQILALGRRLLELETAEATKNGTLVSGEAISIPASDCFVDREIAEGRARTLEMTTSTSAHSKNQGITTAYCSEYKPMGAILAKADNRGNEEWEGEKQ